MFRLRQTHHQVVVHNVHKKQLIVTCQSLTGNSTSMTINCYDVRHAQPLDDNSGKDRTHQSKHVRHLTQYLTRLVLAVELQQSKPLPTDYQAEWLWVQCLVSLVYLS